MLKIKKGFPTEISQYYAITVWGGGDPSRVGGTF